MKQILLRDMYNCNVHLGGNIKKINPKMRPYIMSSHEGIAIIDILKTYTRLFRITLFLKKVIATEGYRVLFVGTQKSIAPIIADIANKSSSSYINERWKGGFLTNFKTVLQTGGTSKNQVFNSESKKFTSDQSNRGRGKTEDISKNSLPDIVIIVGQEKEMKAIKECQKLNIPMITLLDSDGDPSLTNLFIPANDDSRTSVEFILKHIGQAILVGRLLYEKQTRPKITKSINTFN